MDAVNAFVHCDLDEVVYMRMLPGFNQGKSDKVLRLRKALMDVKDPPSFGKRALQARSENWGSRKSFRNHALC